ncbi:MAG: hypothetical protein JWM28_3404, partial [Chitinophagaceae bacterium]|nr:hypothetical protein [Chitinophagaceae bacterium]
ERREKKDKQKQRQKHHNADPVLPAEIQIISHEVVQAQCNF